MGAHSQSVVGSSGEYSESTGVSVSYTLGEAITETSIGDSVTLTQGFHQSKLFVVGLEELLKLNVKVFPNPTLDKVNIQMENNPADLSVEIHDLQGKLISSKALNMGDTRMTISLETLSSGTYLLSITNHQDIRNTYQIVKSN